MTPFALIFDFLLELLADLVTQIFVEVVFGLIAEGVRKLDPERKTLVFLFWLFVGAAAGALSAVAVPHRLLVWKMAPALSIFAGPLLVGACLRWFGSWRSRHGHRPSSLASFLGGASFAFGYSVARYLILR